MPYLTGMKNRYMQLGRKKADRMLGALTVKKSARAYNSRGRIMPGTVFVYQGDRYVMSGQITGGKYLRAYGDTKTNYAVSKCYIARRNEGLVFI